MGGEPGSALRQDFKLAIGGEVEQPLQLDFAGLTAVGVTELALDVHCVTGWSVLGARFKGVRLAELVARVRPKPSARHVIFEAAHGYTANVPLREALKPDVLLAFELDGQALASRHGAPVRAVVPDLYFWKSAKWLTGIRFMTRDEPGFWEVRGYNNHGDPWLEERYG
jgi:DMSO/TMAO reductase YedYZ molybdopterin-dependent catalytic subunit